MERVSVVGCSGSGKSTVARRLSDVLGVPYIELDALHWGPGWSEASAEELSERVRRATAADAWIVDGNYQSKIGTLAWDRANTVVWVNPSRWRGMWRCLRRTVRRAATRQELWNGNRESWSGLHFWRGEDSILWWAWTSYPRVQERYESAMRDPRNRHLAFHRLRTSKEVEDFLATLVRDRRPER
ncbi:adenylate kinase [Streptomyces fragilis]|uniref:adenylate kinase n=1 Tax=Streptomyces fragilis TaxID=67301 RepID=UPI0024DEADD4|nr:adenylate kinase [Streptomyces fragilis]